MAVEHAPVEACEVCGRTILRGETTREYVSPGGERREVCDLCRARVEAADWVRADRLGEQPIPARHERRGSASRWVAERAKQMRERLEEARSGDGRGSSAPAPEPPQARELVPDTRERRLRRALEEFNGSDHRRTVAGLTRSLGEPRVSIVTLPDAPDDVRLTVAWDLSWYQWQVRFGDDGGQVRALAKGSEIHQLEESDRAWNARAADDGRLQLAAGGNASS